MNASRIAIIFLMLSMAWSAHATISLVNPPTGVSAYTTPTDGSTEKPTIYGGYGVTTDSISGHSECETPDGTNTCNSCSGTGLVPCNQKSIYPSLKVHLSILSTEAVPAGTTVIIKGEGVASTTLTPTIAGNQLDVDILWSNLCVVMGTVCSGTATMGVATAANMTIGIDTAGGSTVGASTIVRVVYSPIDVTLTVSEDCPPDPNAPAPSTPNLGYCYVKIVRGDEKVYTDELATVATYPTAPNQVANYAGLVFFYTLGTTAVGTITNTSSNFFIPVNSAATPPSLGDNRVTGLVNEQSYCFIMANQDSTGNIFYFTDTSQQTDAELCAIPSEVVGLLDDKSCFIATAAFGSALAPEVDTFRHFRNEFLLKNSWGKVFVKTYYKYSPPFADFISKNEILRSSARAGLWPLLLFAKTSLHLGVWLTLFMFLSAALLITLIFRRVRKA